MEIWIIPFFESDLQEQTFYAHMSDCNVMVCCKIPKTVQTVDTLNKEKSREPRVNYGMFWGLGFLNMFRQIPSPSQETTLPRPGPF